MPDTILDPFALELFRSPHARPFRCRIYRRDASAAFIVPRPPCSQKTPDALSHIVYCKTCWSSPPPQNLLQIRRSLHVHHG
jgi:hypothetical protein